MVGGLKECGNFAGEKKGTFLLVSQNSLFLLIFQEINNITAVLISTNIIFICTRVPIYYIKHYQ